MLNLDAFATGPDVAVPVGLPVSLDDVYRARELIARFLEPTPTISHPVLGEMMGCTPHVKLENTHSIGSFKIRGGLTLLANMPSEDRSRGGAHRRAGTRCSGDPP